MRFLLLSAVLLSCGGLLPSLHAQVWRRAEVYYMDWHILARARLTPERLREYAEERFVLSEKLSQFVAELKLDELRPAEDTRGGDARLVIDLVAEDGTRASYYADMFALFSADNRLRRPIDAEFRDWVRRLVRNHRAA